MNTFEENQGIIGMERCSMRRGTCIFFAKLIPHRLYSRVRLVRLFKGEKDLAVEQEGEPLGPNIKAELQKEAAQDDTVMEEE